MTRTVSILCALCLAGCQHALLSTTATTAVESEGRSGQQEELPHEPTIARQMASLKPGDKCTVLLTSSTSEYTQEVHGTVASSGDGVLVLSDAEEIVKGRSEKGVPALGDIPYVNRLFRNTGVGSVRKPVGTQTFSAKQLQAVWIDP